MGPETSRTGSQLPLESVSLGVVPGTAVVGNGRLTGISLWSNHVIVRQDDWSVFDGGRRGDRNLDVPPLVVRAPPEEQVMRPKRCRKGCFERCGPVRALVADESQSLERTGGESLATKLLEPAHALRYRPVFDAESEGDDPAGAIIENVSGLLAQVEAGGGAYLVPTIKSKKFWMGIKLSSSFSMDLRTASSTMPRIPPLWSRLMLTVALLYQSSSWTHPSKQSTRTPAPRGLNLKRGGSCAHDVWPG